MKLTISCRLKAILPWYIDATYINRILYINNANYRDEKKNERSGKYRFLWLLLFSVNVTVFYRMLHATGAY